MAHVQLPKFGLAIDWETSGYSVPKYAAKHQGIAFGAIIFDQSTFEPIEELYREIRFNSRYEWADAAERVHGITRAYLNDNGVMQDQAAVDLANLIIKYFGTEDVQLLGHRVHFDRDFNDQLFDSINIKINWHSTLLDTCAMGSILLETTKSDDLFSILGLPLRGKHNALEDIRYTLYSMKKMKEYFVAGVSASL